MQLQINSGAHQHACASGAERNKTPGADVMKRSAN